MPCSVFRCSSHASRLCTCMRSNRGTPHKRRDCSICSGPASPDEIHTFSAENRPAGERSAASPRPITACDDPYIGEQSTTPPPPSKNAAITCVHSSCSNGSLPMLKVIQVPRPTTGMASPLDGICRVAICAVCAREPGATAADKAKAAPPARTDRRVGREAIMATSCRLRSAPEQPEDERQRDADQQPGRDRHVHREALASDHEIAWQPAEPEPTEP